MQVAPLLLSSLKACIEEAAATLTAQSSSAQSGASPSFSNENQKNGVVPGGAVSKAMALLAQLLDPR